MSSPVLFFSVSLLLVVCGCHAVLLTYTPWTTERHVSIHISWADEAQQIVRLSVGALDPPELVTIPDYPNRLSLGTLPNWAAPPSPLYFPSKTIAVGNAGYGLLYLWPSNEILLWAVTPDEAWPANTTLGWAAFDLYYYRQLPTTSWSLASNPPFAPLLGEPSPNRTVYGTRLANGRVVLALEVGQFAWAGDDYPLVPAFSLQTLPLAYRPSRLIAWPVAIFGLDCGNLGLGYGIVTPEGSIAVTAMPQTQTNCMLELPPMVMISWPGCACSDYSCD